MMRKLLALCIALLMLPQVDVEKHLPEINSILAERKEKALERIEEAE